LRRAPFPLARNSAAAERILSLPRQARQAVDFVQNRFSDLVVQMLIKYRLNDNIKTKTGQKKKLFPSKLLSEV
jgi:predicted component of type VI protein secretion system